MPSDRLLEQACMFSERVMGPAHAITATDLAVRNALMNRTPSHLAIPIDLQSWTLEQDTVSDKNVPGHTSTAGQRFEVMRPQEQITAAAEVLNSCRRVAICAGAGRPGRRGRTGAGRGGSGTRASQEAFDKGERASAVMARNLLEEHRVAMYPALQQHQDELRRHV